MKQATRPNVFLLAALAAAGTMLPDQRSREIRRTQSQPEPLAARPPPGEKKAPSANDPAVEQPGASAESPGEIPLKGWWNVLKRAGAGFSEDRVMAEAAGVTFYGLLALFPAIASLISLYGLFSNPATLNDQLEGLGGIVPGGGLDIIKAQIGALTASGHKALGFGAVAGVATSIWSANAGMKSLFDALNVVYHEHEKRSFVRLTVTSLTFTLGAFGFIIIALLAVVVVPLVLNFVGFGGATDMLLDLARWPFMLIVLMGALALIYRYGPSRNNARWAWVSWGSVAAAILWVLVSLGFSYYVSNFGNYNKTYGSLGAVIGFMTWIWISSIVVLMGAELNAELEQQTERDTTVGPDKPRGSRGAYKADTKP
ncbi:YihY/virulence factor BrkB family protein [Lichenicola cladoniae]|uniref:YihY/virulence factor BrkB family protein n=1 Tax=Lichenicola cladoniae TaxID=1484109 RepID=A0A6M8H8Z0_9PROT|nr:YihY/virulence factor BrkB family protein [Lichenicola cladoniae]NPD68543.1 YihY/virulence factor BrkB family protein [Acetobacteraceae bacterium]QKE88973.1 YihY/virulence factor BrkB family protein [Lichenicola cladoniae]